MAQARSRTPIIKALHVLSVLADSPAPQRLSQLAERCGMIPSTTSRLLADLVESGWAARDEHEQYVVGPRLLKIAGSPYLRSALSDLCWPVIDRLARRFEMMANLQVLQPDGSRVLAVAHSNRYAGVYEHQGQVVPVDQAAGGIVQLAHLGPEARRKYVERVKDESSRAELAGFYERLRAAEANPVYLEGRVQPLFASLADAVVTDDGACHCALAVFGLRHEFTETRVEEITGAVRQAARAVADVLDAREEDVATAMTHRGL